jgi:hypothetical protein
MIIVAAPSKGGIIVEADRTFLTQLVKKNLSNSGMPGRVENVEVNLHIVPQDWSRQARRSTFSLE